MKPISARVHAIFDCVFGVFIAAMPWLLGFYRMGAESWVPVFIGACIVIFFLFTGIRQVLPMRIQLRLDLVAGIILAVSPWVFRFDRLVYWPHLASGLAIIVVALLSSDYTPRSAGKRRTGMTEDRRAA